MKGQCVVVGLPATRGKSKSCLSMVEVVELVTVCCGEISMSVGAACNYVQCVEHLDPFL